MSLRRSKKSGTTLSDKRLAHKVLSRVEIRDVTLTSVTVTNHLPSGRLPKRVKITIEAQCKTEATKSGPQLQVQTTFTVLGMTQESGKAEVLSIKFALILVYSLTSDDGLDEIHLDAFTKWVGLNNAWPYAREFVQNIMSRMVISPLKLPLYKPEQLALGTPDQPPATMHP